MKKILLFLSIIFSEYLVSQAIFGRGIPFWYDPARDLLLSLKNSTSLTIIGPPSGIPGIFYGPYWIWILSLVMKFTLDPGLITLFVLGIPYSVLYPIILFKFSDTISPKVLFILSFLFIMNFTQYAVQLWNPHPASLLTILLIYSLTKLKLSDKKKFLISGIISGLLIMMHISFGTIVFLSSIIFICLKNRRMSKIFYFFSGLFITLIPSALFEIRHSFLQTKSVFALVSSSLQDKFQLVDQKGLSKIDIVQNYLSIFSKIFGGIEAIKVLIFIFVVITSIVFIYHEKKQKRDISDTFVYCAIILITTLLGYLLARNPIWTYHFIGLETPVLILIGIVAEQFSLIKIVLYAGFIANLYLAIPKYFSFENKDVEKYSTFGLKRHVVLDILNKSKGSVTYYAYSEGVYTYDYDYLFTWLGRDRVTKDEVDSSDYVYLIIPKTSWGVFQDFINYKTPNGTYKTIWAKTYKDGTTVILRYRV